jgi:RNase P subunit RPR2
MNRLRAGIKRKTCLGRCDRCGRLMVMVRLQDPLGETNPRVGWQCLICGTVVDLRSLVGHSKLRELREREAPRHCPRPAWRDGQGRRWRIVQHG